MEFRSQEMEYYELSLAKENAWAVLNELGNISILHFEDLNSHLPMNNKPYYHNLKDIEELEHRLLNIQEIVNKYHPTLTNNIDIKHFLKKLSDKLSKYESLNQKSKETFFREIEENIEMKNNELENLMDNKNKIEEQSKNLNLYLAVLKDLQAYIPDNFINYEEFDKNTIGDNNLIKASVGFQYICGVIDSSQVSRFQKLAFRITRNNVYLNFIPLQDITEKSVFLMVFEKSKNNNLKQKLSKLVDSFNSVKFTIPADKDSYANKVSELENQILEKKIIINETETQLKLFCTYFLQSTLVEGYANILSIQVIVAKEKSIFECLNKMSLSDNVINAAIFVSKLNKQIFENKILDIRRNLGFKINLLNPNFESLNKTAPTLFENNDLTEPYQMIVNTYGIPRYREVNPAQFTVVSFPYEFGVMFGDIGHGGLLLIFGTILAFFSKKMGIHNNSLLSQVLPFRYLLFAMGLFAFYCGLVYNDFMSFPLRIFSSCFKNEGEEFDKKSENCVYSLGIDPTWYMSTGEITFLNSFKMKLSIIIGVCHMTLGILLKAFNSLYFKRYLEFVFEFLPQIIFFMCTFGYMCAAIIIKWVTKFEDTSMAPSIIAIFIDGGVAKKGNVLYGDEEGLFQTKIQQTLFLISFICIPLMLLPKPLIELFKIKFGKKNGHQAINNINNSEAGEKLLDADEKHAEHHEEHDIGEIFVHQLIETIEFVMGAVSNTASYLRLWALSLAHSQLAKVFLEMTVVSGMKGGSFIAVMIGFPVFVFATFAVLMVMDLMECFLHTLRLHWVEFQNKFYKGDGYLFNKFSFVDYIKNDMSK